MVEEIKIKKIIFFIESLRSGGKERRFLELISNLNNNKKYQLLVVLTDSNIEYLKFYELDIKYIIIERNYGKKDLTLFLKFYLICKKYNPDIIHSWGSMVTFYLLPIKMLNRIPVINSQITDAPNKIEKYSFNNIINKVSLYFSDIILSNSNIGLLRYNANPKKSFVIYNGIDLKRLNYVSNKEFVKSKYNINTKYIVVMVANYSIFKKNQLFIDIANNIVEQRKDVTFISVGGGNTELMSQVKSTIKFTENIKIFGKSNDVDNIINISDIGVLFTNGEGISNTIMEYMLFGKPFIAHKYGGTPELISDRDSGTLIETDDVIYISKLINDLLNCGEKRKLHGRNGNKLIREKFAIERMVDEFINIYDSIDSKKINKLFL